MRIAFVPFSLLGLIVISQAQGAPPVSPITVLDGRGSVLEGQNLDVRITSLESQDLDGRLSTLEVEVPTIEATANSALSQLSLADQRLDALEAETTFLRTLIVRPTGPTALDNGAELL